jgi:copper homeostasis protein
MAQPAPPPVRIEAAIETLAGAIAAAGAGAYRLELGAGLALGGLTPGAGVLEAVREAVAIELVVLIRPRAGDFLYAEEEIETMRRDVRLAAAAGADGVALGVLTADGRVDRERCRELIELARPMQVCFHRAFDRTRDPLEALDQLLELGVDRVLSSGQERDALSGAELLRRMVERAAGRLGVLPGGGVRPDNVARLVQISGASEVHFSAEAPAPSAMRWQESRCRLAAEGLLFEEHRLLPDPERLLAVRRALRAIGR